MTRKGTGFTTIALPERFTNRLDEMIKKSNGLYTSRSHIVKLALVDFFDKNNGSDGENERHSDNI